MTGVQTCALPISAVRAEKQKPGFQQDKGMINRAAARGIHESRFDRLNALFESIISLDEQQYSYTISSFIEQYLKKYLGGMNMTSLKPMIDAVQSSYAQKQGKAALQKLASAAYSLYSVGGDQGSANTQPSSGSGPTAGTDNAGQGSSAPSGSPSNASSTQSGTPSSPTSKGQTGKTDINQILQSLPKLKAKQLKSLQAAVNAALASKQQQGTAATAAAPQAQAVDISQLKQQRQAQGQASQQQAIDQMKQTAATNAATSAADTQLAAQVKAEKQKPEFQQDKGMLRRAAARGI